jgi:hypothetical protein
MKGAEGTTRLALGLWLGVHCLSASRLEASEAPEAPVECTIVYEAPGGFFVDAGADRGLTAGSQGIVLRDGKTIARVEVLRTAKRSALVRVLPSREEAAPGPGDLVHIFVQRPPAAVDDDVGGRSEGAPSSSTTLKEPGTADDFVPLLAPPEHRSPALADPRNIFHGQLRLHQLFQIDPDADRDYSVTRLGSHGGLERIGGTPWALEWSGNLSYRDGDALENTRDYRKLRLHAFNLALFRKFEDQSSVRLGRFVPRPLPAVGFVDGFQGEKVLNEHFRLGAVAGFKPTRTRLDLSVREPLATPYLTVETGDREDLYYSGTVGLLGSLYEGDPDRLALLLDQRLSVGPRFSLFSTSEVDFDIGAMETRSGTRLTHLDLYADYRLTEALSLRAGLDHYERPDTEAERDLLRFQDDAFFDRGYWRYWVGASQALPWHLRLSGEIALIDSPVDDYEPRWHISLTRTGLPLLPGGSVTLSAYNFESYFADGYGGRISAYFPFLDHRLSLETSAAFRLLETTLDSEDFAFTDVSARIHWALSRAWGLHGGLTYSFGDVERYILDLGITYRW